MKPPKNPLAGNRGEKQKRTRGLFVPKWRERRRPGESRRPASDPTLDGRLGELGIPSAHAAGRAELSGYMSHR